MNLPTPTEINENFCEVNGMWYRAVPSEVECGGCAANGQLKLCIALYHCDGCHRAGKRNIVWRELGSEAVLVHEGVTYTAKDEDSTCTGCVGCAFSTAGTWVNDCILSCADTPTRCCSKSRKDKRNIIWIKEQA